MSYSEMIFSPPSLTLSNEFSSPTNPPTHEKNAPYPYSRPYHVHLL